MTNTNPALKIHIDAHTDARGEATAQLVLAQQRAEAVMNYLQTKGVAEERLSARGHGGSTPLKVDAVQARIHRFLKEGDELTEGFRSEEHTSELQSRPHLVCRLLLEKKTEIRICCAP